MLNFQTEWQVLNYYFSVVMGIVSPVTNSVTKHWDVKTTSVVADVIEARVIHAH